MRNNDKEYRQSLMAIIANYLAYRWIFAICTYGVLVVYDFLKYRNTKLVVGEKTIVFKTGVLRPKARTVSYERIQSFDMGQSSLGRKVSYGTVTMQFDDDSSAVFKFASHPEDIVKMLDKRVKTTGAGAVNVKTDAAKWQSLVVGQVNDASIREVRASCRESELPKYIIGDGINGVLAVFNDRCIVIKKGLATSFMASSLGGGRTATFAYRDITGIEYNSGIITGVLEILTASYSGKATNSPWSFGNDRSAHESSNTLPWDKKFYNKVRPQIEWMQQKIHESKTANSQPVLSKASDAGELSKLAALHKQGILTDKEFIDAKQRILNKF